MADRGIEDFDSGSYKREVDAAIAKKMREMGVVAVQYAQYLAPTRTGHLRQSIRYEYDESAHQLRLVASVPYAIFVEFGTYKMAARPYLRPAIEKASEALARGGVATGANLAMSFVNAARIKNPEVLAHPRNARHAAIMRSNLATSIGFNRGAGGQAKQFIHHRRGR